MRFEINANPNLLVRTKIHPYFLKKHDCIIQKEENHLGHDYPRGKFD